MSDIGRRRSGMAARPPLDLAMQRSELVRLFPLFDGMTDDQIARLSARVRTVYAEPGDVLLRRDEVPHNVWFIASGAVEAVQAGQKTRLGRGEMFGQIALLTRKTRRVQVSAITQCTLLTLDEAPFLALLRDNAALQALVRETAERRGVKIDLEALASRPAPPPRRSLSLLRTAWRRRGM
jgi:CPA1 family monovalent cation:H+ antiporter